MPVIDILRDSIGFACLAAAGFGSAYALLAAVLIGRWRPPPTVAAGAQPGVTIVKPLHGAEPGLFENLASFCAQDYGGPVQILFGVQEESDPAVAVVQRLRAAYPARDLDLVPTPGSRGANPKMSNLVALAPRIRQAVVVLSDSDIAVPRDYLAHVVAALQAPGVGLVTCLYRGQARNGFAARLAAMAIDHHFLPGVVVGLALRLARPCFGSTIALRAETLAAIGGFEAFLEFLADDHAIGEAVRRSGMQVAIPRLVVVHTCSERTFGELFRHELRWARTIRAVNPAGYAASVLAHPLPLAALGAAVSGFAAGSGAMIAVALLARLVLALRVDHTLGVASRRWALGPVRDFVSFAVFVAGFFVAVVTWRGRRYRVRPDGTLAAIA